MTKTASAYVCQECGSEHPKWIGKCEGCHAWNSLVEESVIKKKYKGALANNQNIELKGDLTLSNITCDIEEVRRIDSSSDELNRVLGGGIVPGSAVLLGGDPGIGKSTLLLQTLVKLAAMDNKCVYISGEESVSQIKLRAQRLNMLSDKALVASITSLQDIVKIVKSVDKLDLLIIDSIQTVYSEVIESSPGSVAQVRACAFELIRMAKLMNFSVLFVGHVTKDGSIAGPKVLEHMVDTVLYFEGDKGYQYRIIRAVKNRFGAANEIGVFEMQASGLIDIINPSQIFLPTTEEKVSGSAIFAGVEGSRPILIEVQALIAPSYLASPRRAVIGWDNNRLAMLLAVLNSRAGINLLDKEVYLNIVGGIKVTEPAADLAVVAALISAYKDTPIPRGHIFFGEVGLSGEIRRVSLPDHRLKESQKLGFKTVFGPKDGQSALPDIEYSVINHIISLNNLI